MYLTSLSIRNFRGIKALDIEFDPTLTVVMGENNTGKSSILNALDICLNQVKSEKGVCFEPSDFHLDDEHKSIDDSEPIQLTVSFVETENVVWSRLEKQRLSDIDVGVENSEVHLRVEAKFNLQTREIEQTISFLNSNGEVLPGKESPKNLKALRSCVPFFLQGALRDAARTFGGQSSYWLELIKANELSLEDKTRFEKEIQDVQRRLIEAYGGFTTVTQEIDHVSDILDTGLAGHVTVEPKFPDVIRAIRYETEVNYQTAEQSKIPLENFGEGTQSLAVMMLFNAYLKMKMASGGGFTAPILGIEEPEAHLHPNAVYSTWNTLKNLAGQKIVVTHSGEIVSQTELGSIRKIQRDRNGAVVGRLINLMLTDKEKEKFRINFKRGRGELFFSRVWILVEGATELEVYDRCADIMGEDLYRHGIGIVQYAQIGLEVILKIADAFGIKCVLTADNDSKGQSYLETFRHFTESQTRDILHSCHPLPYSTIETYLCSEGWSAPYLSHLEKSSDPVARALLDIQDEQRDASYWDNVYKFIKSNKPHLVNEALDMMANCGVASVPDYITSVIRDACS